jgi:hypothetical protein
VVEVLMLADGYKHGYEAGQEDRQAGRNWREPGWWYCSPPKFREGYIMGWKDGWYGFKFKGER